MQKVIFFSLGFIIVSMLSGQDSLKIVQLNELAISAIRASEVSPVTQSTLNRKSIQLVDYGQDAALTLERLSPSIITFSDAGTAFGNYHNFRLRGMDQSRINITLNGVPLNDMIDQGVFFSNFSDFSSSMESIQIQRGVGISSNGTSSYAGSISYESFDITNLENLYSASFSIGSFKSLRLNAEAFTGMGDAGHGTYLRVSRLTSDGYKYNSESDAHSFFLSHGKKLRNGLIKLTAFSGRAQNQQSYLPVLIDDIEADPRTNYFPPQDEDDFRQEMIQLQYSAKKGSSTFGVSGYYGGARGYFPFTFGEDQFIYSLQNDHYGALANFTNIFTNGQVSTGVHVYQFDRINESATVETLDAPYYADTSGKSEISSFVKWEKDKGNWTLMLDTQLRYVNMEFTSDTLTKYHGQRTANRKEFFLNPRIGLTYLLNDQSNLYISFGRTGREPTRIDLMQGDSDGIKSWNYNTFTDKSIVKSEFVNDLEIGYRLTTEKARISVNAFHMSFQDEISAVGGLVHNTYFQLRQNVRRSQRMGLEIDGLVRLNDRGTFTEFRGTFMKSNVDTFDTGTEILTNVEHVFLPDIVLTHGIGHRKNGNTFLVETKYVTSSFMELSNRIDYRIPGFSVVNLSYGRAFGNLEVWGRVNNLFNEKYFTDGGPVDADYDNIPEGPGFRIQAPRNFTARISYLF